ncbi:MAG TPA: type IX secretion system sortase PorU, partial [Chitinophagaceae bacterium]|nr:type IX secretion system sortase PorU [Chitinophagaceae bacterium]
DDLKENSIQVVDGGDGIINGQDYILFFAPGPDEWIKDSVNARFSHRKNLYSDKSFYFISVGGSGKRIPTPNNNLVPTTNISNFTERYYHELDSVNFLSSGKEWYGEEFANAPGKTLSRNFTVNFPNLQNGSTLFLQGSLVARSVGASSRFDIRIDNGALNPVLINPVTGAIYDLFGQSSSFSTSSAAVQNNININFSFTPGSFSAQGWLNWFELFGRRNLSMNGINQLLFRDWTSVSAGSVGEFVISNTTGSTQVWEVTDPANPVKMQGTLVNSDFHFINTCSRLREYIAFNPNNFLVPLNAGIVPNQDLHHSSPADFIIITAPLFLSQATRLAQYHQQHDGMRTLVATTEQVYNEFGSGSPDPTSIRDFVKMYFDKYGNDPANAARHLLLLGDASFDYKDRLNNNTNLVPAYETNNSLDPLASYVSDDYFGFLNDNEDINSVSIINLLDIGIGRIPSKTLEEAKNVVDKIFSYTAKESLGPWRNNFTLIADDEDINLHFQDAESFSATTNSTAPVLNQQKIYLDAFQQESGAGGSRYPQANQAIDNQIFNGTLFWNFTGHGSARRLAEETVLDQEIVNSWNNPNHLPLFITTTCDFAPYDNPVINSLGENILLRPKTGAIGLMTTTRAVFAFSNRVINNNYLQIALQPDGNGKYKSLGESLKAAKNFTYQTSSDINNNRKFTLLGDPALTLAIPTLKARATKVNGIPIAQPDTLSSTEKIVMEGEVTDFQGNLLNNFNGFVYPTVFDKPQIVNTIGNDPGSQPAPFVSQNNVLFKGKATVLNGKFSFSFKVPKDINYQFGNGRLSLYAEDGTRDANGYFTGFVVGGTGTNSGNDNEGPVIKPYLNDEKFVNGGTTNQHPVLIVKLTDSSGINTVGNGIGHDIVATLDNDNHQFFILNDFFEGDLDSYQQGIIRFQLPELEPGPHSIRIKAWDVLNNSNEAVLDFVVGKDEELVISHVLNYPNPFTTHTEFWFEHNKPGQDLQVFLQVFTLTGRVIKTLKKTINTPGNRSSELGWNGLDEYGEKVGRGVYLYRLIVTVPGSAKKEKTGKLVIF